MASSHRDKSVLTLRFHVNFVGNILLCNSMQVTKSWQTNHWYCDDCKMTRYTGIMFFFTVSSCQFPFNHFLLYGQVTDFTLEYWPVGQTCFLSSTSNWPNTDLWTILCQVLLFEISMQYWLHDNFGCSSKWVLTYCISSTCWLWLVINKWILFLSKFKIKWTPWWVQQTA